MMARVKWAAMALMAMIGTMLVTVASARAAGDGVTVAGGNGDGSAADQLDVPYGVAVDGSGNVYVADNFNDRVQQWASGATSGVTVAGGNGNGSAADQLDFPYAVALGADGTLYVADTDNNRVQAWSAAARALDQLSGLQAASVGLGGGASLANKVQAITAKAAAGNSAGACGSLGGYVNQVQAQSGKKIPLATATALIDLARQTAATLGCTI